MKRFKITIEYNGTGLMGWQVQNDHYTVQEALEKALNKASGGQEIEIFGSGRTDAGVHATGQVAHFDIDGNWEPFRIKEAINFYLRQDDKQPYCPQVVVLSAEEVADDFHSRFSAVKRHYIYRIINRREHVVLERDRAWNVSENLDVEKMASAARLLLGNHDFTSFRSTECQAKSPVKTLDQLDVFRDGDVIEMRISARSFLHHQVRNLAGTLRLIGNGKWTEADLLSALAAKDRRAAGETAPACGLYLIKVDY